MNQEPKIVISPSKYKGWDLEYSKSHDGESDYRAEKDKIFLYASSLQDLLAKIARADEITVRFKTPIPALYLDEYSNKGWQECRIVMIHERQFIFIDEKGETQSSFRDKLNLDREQNPKRRFIHLTKANYDKLVKADKLIEKARLLEEQSRKIRHTLDPITDADLMLEAKR